MKYINSHKQCCHATTDPEGVDGVASHPPQMAMQLLRYLVKTTSRSNIKMIAKFLIFYGNASDPHRQGMVCMLSVLHYKQGRPTLCQTPHLVSLNLAAMVILTIYIKDPT